MGPGTYSSHCPLPSAPTLAVPTAQTPKVQLCPKGLGLCGPFSLGFSTNFSPVASPVGGDHLSRD